MKILIKTYEDSYDYLVYHKLYIDGVKKLHIGRCEPEDAIIGRDLVDAVQISEFMKSAYDACKNGEEFSIEIKKCTEEEWEED